MAWTNEEGSTGLVEFSGIVQEDYLREFHGLRAYKRYREMRDNSPIIGAALLAIENSIRGVKWNFTSKAGADDPRLELLNASRDAMHGMSGNMSQPGGEWSNHISEALSFLAFGFSLFEVVYQRDPKGRYQYLWDYFAPRSQDTVNRWLFSERGRIMGFEQVAAPIYKPVALMSERLIHYRIRVEKNNPEGRSLLRNAWAPYYYAKNIQKIEAIGIERDLAGLPVVKLPQGANTDPNDTASDYSKAHKIVRNVRNDEQAGLVVPFGWEVELLSTGGSRQFDTDKIINRYDTRQLMAFLAQFLLLGQESVGSFSLSSDQTDFFTMSVNTVADIISTTFTDQAIPILCRINGVDSEGLCLEHTPAGDVDIARVSDFLQKTSSLLTWTPQDEVWLRGLSRMPELDEESIAEEREIKQQRAAQIARQTLPAQPPPEDDTDEDMPMSEEEAHDRYTANMRRISGVMGGYERGK